MVYEITAYKDERGREPVVEFLESLADSEFARFQAVIEQVKQNGTNIKGDIGHWVGDLFQIRFKECRCFMYKADTNTFVLLHAFKKKTNKTEPREIKKGEAILKKDQEHRQAEAKLATAAANAAAIKRAKQKPSSQKKRG